ncbi:MAG: hypothetical protein HY849_06340 [Nitrosomonadales bacterium]|nr:hypothetical protein [Nitrosomonadales bacterium]
MSRLLFLAAVVVLIYLLLRRFRKPPAAPAAPESSEDMVCCAHCGVHLPKSESLPDGDEFYCSAAHRDARRASID